MIIMVALCFTTRLENAFYELAQSYYHGECRRVKAHKVSAPQTSKQGT